MKLKLNVSQVVVSGLAASVAAASASQRSATGGQDVATSQDSFAQGLGSASAPNAAPLAPQPAVRQRSPQRAVQVPLAPQPASSFPTNRPLTAGDFQSSEVVARTGQQIAVSQRGAQTKQDPRAELFTFRDALGRLNNVAGSAEKRAAVALDVDQAKRVVTHLGAALQAKAPERIKAVYNYYPQGMQFDDDQVLHLATDGDNNDFHAEFEPINRLGFTARLDHSRLAALYDAYKMEKSGRSVTADELFTSGQCKYLFDLLYFFYFVDEAIGDGKDEATKQAYLGAADAQLGRLRADQAHTYDAQMPQLNLPAHTNR